jgi:SAM-dependent methyltransferase
MGRLPMNETNPKGDDLGLGLLPGDRHYRAYVGPPEDYDLIAAMTFNLLTTLGLRQHHTLADIGCGSLRAGRLFIPYLNVGHYVGIEPNQWLVEEGIRREVGADLIRIKQPRFYYSDSPAVLADSHLTIDFAVAQSIFSHCGLDLIRAWLGAISPVLAPTGALAATFLLASDDYRGTGWVYPECVSFTLETLTKTAADVGLRLQVLDWRHPRQTWVLLCREGFNSAWFQDKALTWNLARDRVPE